MAWPQSQDYNEAIQNPQTSFGDPELRGGRAVTNALGMPMPRSGNFADVYEFIGASGARWAIKCFTRAVSGLQERYSEINKHLIQAKLPFAVDFDYLGRGIRIRGECHPVLKMQWVEGLLLNEFVRNNLDKTTVLEGLGQIWLRMAKCLREANMAHGDLQHGNVILVPGTNESSLAVRLIDYDGMWVPALANKNSGEVGHPAYQHPQRLQQGNYNAEVDRLSLLAIACALRSVVVGGKALWDRYDNGDNLLFREADLRNPAASELFKLLWSFPDAATHNLTGYLTLALSGLMEQTPLLTDVFVGEETVALTAAQEQQVSAVLGASAKVNRPASTAARPRAKPGEPPATFRSPSKVDEGSPSRSARQAARSGFPLRALTASGAVGAVVLFIAILWFRYDQPPARDANPPQIPKIDNTQSAGGHQKHDPHSPDHLALDMTTDHVAGESIRVLVKVVDKSRDVVITDTSKSKVTVEMKFPMGGKLKGTTTRFAENGIAAFDDLAIEKAGAGYVLTASRDKLAGDSAEFAIAPGSAQRLVFGQQPKDAEAGQSINPSVTVVDKFGNVVKAGKFHVTLATTLKVEWMTLGHLLPPLIFKPPGTLEGSTIHEALAGEATFSDVFIKKASDGYTLMARHDKLTGASSEKFNITHAAAEKLVFDMEPANPVANQLVKVRVNVVDKFNNKVTNDGSKVKLAIKDPQGALLENASVAAVNGLATLKSPKKAGAGYTLTASHDKLRGDSKTFEIAPAKAFQLVFDEEPTATFKEDWIPTVKVKIQDEFRNPVTSYKSELTLAIKRPPAGTLQGTRTRPAVDGVATFDKLSVNFAGTYVLTAYDSKLTGESKIKIKNKDGCRDKELTLGKYMDRERHFKFPFFMETGETYEIEMQSSKFKPFLFVLDPNGDRADPKVITPGEHSISISFKAPKTAEYTIIATHFLGSGYIGEFTLTARQADASGAK